MIDFPDYWDAPRLLLRLDAACGPISIWGTLKYFRVRRRSSDYIINACRHGKNGCFAICLAAALRGCGLNVAFHTDSDPSPARGEKICFKTAEQIGVKLGPGIDLDTLVSRINKQRIAIVLFQTLEEQPHFSPCLGMEGETLILPYYSSERPIDKRDFITRWDRPDFLRQCILVSRTDA